MIRQTLPGPPVPGSRPPACGACGGRRRSDGWWPRPGSSIDDLVAPLFVADGLDDPRPILSLPGVVQHTRRIAVQGGRAAGRPRGPGVDPLRRAPAGGQGCGGSARPSPRRHRAAGAGGGPGRGRRRDGADGRSLPRRVHRPRPLRRPRPGPATVDNDATLALYAEVAVAQADGRRRPGRPERDDGRAGRRHPRRPRRRGPRGHGHPGLRRQVRLGPLRAVPRGGRT